MVEKGNVYNTSKLAFHEDKIRSFAENKITAPIYVRIKPINRCNHSCFYCSYVPENDCPVSEIIDFSDEIPLAKMLEILDDFKEIGVQGITFSGGGEPLIYRHIVEVMKKAKEHGINISIITNGQQLNGEKAQVLKDASWVRVSTGEIDAETFEAVRKRPEAWFNELTENLRSFAKIKSDDCELGINFVVNELNYTKVYESAKHFKELGVNHVKFTPVYALTAFFERHAPMKENVLDQLKRAKEDFNGDGFVVYDTYENDFSLTSKNERTYNRCYIMQTVPVIGADSVVYFCHDKTYTKSGTLGSLKDTTFKDLWFSDESKKIFKEWDPEKTCKHHCTYDTRNLGCQSMIDTITIGENLDKFKPDTERFKEFI